MIFIDAIEIDERLASYFVGSDPFLRDHLIRFRFSEFAIPAPVLELDEPAPLVSLLLAMVHRGALIISTIVESRPGRVSWHLHRVTCVDSLCEMTLLPWVACTASTWVVSVSSTRSASS